MKSSNPKNLYKPSAGGNKNLVRALFAIVVCLFIFIFRGRQATSQDNLFDKLESSEELLSKHASKELELTDTVSNLESKVKILEDRLKESHDERDAALKSLAAARNIRGASGNKKEDGGGEDVEAMKKSVDLVSTQIEHLKKQMQKKAKIDAIKNFGPGPHRVKFELDFNPEEVPEGDATSFIIEMAPLKLMPYTVNFFLSQVSLGLFNGCSFHRNAHHVVQGGPVANHLSHGTNLYKGFKSAGLESVSFQEYSPDFPHVKYTLGYAGRPGGPDFYVSTLDNTRNHGPGGQASYAVKSEADPCFAKVVDGFAAVDRMHKLSVESGDYMRMKHYVAIKSATIMTEKN